MKRADRIKCEASAALVCASAMLIGAAGCGPQKGLNMGGNNMVWAKLTANMMVDDVNRTVSFYADVLDCEFVLGVPEKSQEIVTTWNRNQPLGFAIMKCGDVEVMFQATESLAEETEFKDMKVSGSVMLYIEVKDVDGLFSRIASKVQVIKEPHVTFYGMKEFYIRDCNGYILSFAQRIGK